MRKAAVLALLAWILVLVGLVESASPPTGPERAQILFDSLVTVLTTSPRQPVAPVEPAVVESAPVVPDDDEPPLPGYIPIAAVLLAWSGLTIAIHKALVPYEVLRGVQADEYTEAFDAKMLPRSEG